MLQSDIYAETTNNPLPYVLELVETILLYLPAREIVRASGVCVHWRSCIAGTPALLRATHKMPSPCPPDMNPHFIEPNRACRNALFPLLGSAYYGSNVLKLCQDTDVKLLSAMRPGISDEENEALSELYGEERYSYRRAFKGVRYPNGWPECYRTYCNLCSGFHAQFRFENLHPLLSFLDDVTMCVRGYGPHLYIKLSIINELETTEACYQHYYKEIKDLAGKLRWAGDMMEKGERGKELFTRPLCTRLVAPSADAHLFVNNEEGVTLGEALPFLIRAFKAHLDIKQHSLYDTLRCTTTRCASYKRERRVAFPTDEDFEKFDRDLGNLVERFDSVIREVNEAMKGIAAWDEAMFWREGRDMGLVD
jgi:hypothetical protein